MRLLIAGGGTGGHIYPALAVARSLRARPDAAELAWLGGHRGLEATLVPPAGIPLRRLLLRSLRSAGRDVHLVLDPIRLGLSVPQAFAAAARAAARRRSSRPAATSRSPRCSPRAVLRIPSVLWEGNVVPGRSVRFVARLAERARGELRGDRGRAGRTGARTSRARPIRSLAGVDPDEARERFGGRPGERILLVFGGSQAVKRINDAVVAALPRLVERVRVVHVTGDAGYAAALAAGRRCPPTCATATGRTRSSTATT